MANQVAAILSGMDYQHLCSWYHVLELLKPRWNVARVRVEDEDAVSADDVTVRLTEGSRLPDRYYQIKYHMNQAGQYSTDYLIARKGNESSLLQKLFKSWRTLRDADPNRSFEIRLISNWGWDTGDKLKPCIGGAANGLVEEFFTATEKMDVGKLRKKWRDELAASPADFEAFMRTLRFKLGFDCWEELARGVSDRMDSLGLKSQPSHLLIAAGIIRDWIKAGPQDITLEILESTLRTHDLFLPPETEPAVHIHLVTIKEQKYDFEPDYMLDWRPQFVGPANEKGHLLTKPGDWNAVLLPKLKRLEARINKETNCRLIRARGQARLSAWFAFGRVFSQVNRYTVEVDQLGKHWRTDAECSPDFSVVSNGSDGEVMSGGGGTVAVGISVSGDLAGDVREDLDKRGEKIASLLLIRPERALGHDCLRGAGDAVALATKTKELMLTFTKRWSATRMLLYYYGPLGGAVFIGHKMNAICREIQVMENQQPGYAPSFLLQ
jgi:hypothetical protein